MVAGPTTVPELLRAGRARWPDAVCVATPTERLTYAQLDDRSTRLATELVRVGVAKGGRVGLLFPNGVDWVVAWAAVTRIGAVAVPVNTFYRASELGRFLRHADVQVLIGVPSFLGHDYVARLEQVAPELADHELTEKRSGRLLLPSLPQLRVVLLRGESRRSWARPWPHDAIPDPALVSVVAGLGEDVTPADVQFVSYTSGSTGEPKGVVHGHGTVLRHAATLGGLSELDPSTRIWSPMPLCWVGGLVFCLLRALVSGGCYLTQEVFEPGAALAFLAAERVTHVSAWPAVTKALVEHPDFPSTDLSSLQVGLWEAMPPDRRPLDPGLVVGSLGMSETAGPHTYKTRAEDLSGASEEHRGAFGRPVPGTQHRIVDPDTGLDLPEGEVGEVLVRGAGLMLGLHRREPAEVFDADGWYHTGDRGRFADGWFWFHGRQADLIKTGGSNVSPAEVEQCLMADEDVKLAFVLGVPDEVKGERVVALAVTSAGRTADGSELRERLRSRLSSFKVPEQVFVIDDEQVPWLVSQKADRRALLTLAERLAAGA